MAKTLPATVDRDSGIQTIFTTSRSWDMAQTQRMGLQNERAQQHKSAEVFALPYG
jgi:hypothetical protein